MLAIAIRRPSPFNASYRGRYRFPEIPILRIVGAEQSVISLYTVFTRVFVVAFDLALPARPACRP
jgi:hypothetical protein